jgi:hypothetical protein
VRLVGKERCARIAHGGNPVTRWMAANVAVARDPASNGQGQESIGPIDGKLGATSSPCSRSPSRRLRRVWPSQVRGYPIVDRLIEFRRWIALGQIGWRYATLPTVVGGRQRGARLSLEEASRARRLPTFRMREAEAPRQDDRERRWLFPRTAARRH